MHQPIHWHEWGEEAFAAARDENKPILLDIGAVWCHWCHVMDRESYDDPAIAQIINEHFIAVKVDRDERPDVDSRYQIAVNAISGQGGWPLTAFLTPDGHPYFGGTYFPPNDLHGRPSFKRVLQTLADAYRTKNSDVMESAENAMGAIAQAESFYVRPGSVTSSTVEGLVQATVKMFDAHYGGFGSQPKFPHPAALDLLIDYYARIGDEQIKTVVTTTLKKMAAGGVYDQLAGGFHRYSVDEQWIVPHFEKMSYDNSELLKNYVHAFQTFVDPFYGDVARDIIRWMDEWLSDREQGGFYASQDADYSMDDDGDYFTWTVDETKAVLEGDELSAAVHYYDIGEMGEMHHNHHKNVLFVKVTPEQLAVRLKTDVPRALQILESAKQKMYAARKLRPTPYVDKSIYVSWNALCISAYLEAARTLNLPDAKHFALKSLDRILGEAWDGKKLAHLIAYSDPQAQKRYVTGMIDDYAFLLLACLDAYEATSDLTYYKFSEKIADAMIAKFYDATSGAFFDTEHIASGAAILGALVARRKPLQDSPTPAGNSLAALGLLRLHGYANREEYREKAEDTLEAFASIIEQLGMFAASYGLAATCYLHPHTQVCVIGEGSDADGLRASAVARYAVNKAVLQLKSDQVVKENLPPALSETLPNLPRPQGKSVAVICSGFSCKPPISDPDEVAKALNESVSAGATVS